MGCSGSRSLTLKSYQSQASSGCVSRSLPDIQTFRPETQSSTAHPVKSDRANSTSNRQLNLLIVPSVETFDKFDINSKFETSCVVSTDDSVGGTSSDVTGNNSIGEISVDVTASDSTVELSKCSHNVDVVVENRALDYQADQINVEDRAVKTQADQADFEGGTLKDKADQSDIEDSNHRTDAYVEQVNRADTMSSNGDNATTVEF